MIRLIINRLVMTIPLLLMVSILVFLMVHAMPGSVAEVILRDSATPEAVAQLEAELGLHDPLPVQYFRWLSGVLRGDFGESLVFRKPVMALYREGLPITLSLAFTGLFVGVTLGLVLGILAGLRPGSIVDRVSTILASVAVAMPAFWIGMLLAIYLSGISPVFGMKLDWFPVIGYTPFYTPEGGWNIGGWLHNITLPALALGIPSAALVARQMRSSLGSVLQTTYIQAQRAMGLSTLEIVVIHALKNAMIPVITVIGFRFAVVIGSAFVIERVFGIVSGAGSILIRATIEQDIPVVQAGVMIVAALIVFFNTLIDISYAWLNPKIRV